MNNRRALTRRAPQMTTKWEIQGARALLAQSPLPVLYVSL